MRLTNYGEMVIWRDTKVGLWPQEQNPWASLCIWDAKGMSLNWELLYLVRLTKNQFKLENSEDVSAKLETLWQSGRVN